MKPLAIVQARMASRRLPGKMLMDLGGKPLVMWSIDAACEAFGEENVVVAPSNKTTDFAIEEEVLQQRFCRFHWFYWNGPEQDVLGRFHAVAHTYRWHPDSVIVRVTADDPFKDPEMMKRVAEGERLPVEQGAEAFTLAMLDAAIERHPYVGLEGSYREHITWALFGTEFFAPPAPPGIWTIDTMEDLEAARKKVG